MAYTPPVGVVDLDLTGTSYTRPVGEVILDLGATAAPARTLAIGGETLAPTGIADLRSGRALAIAGETLAPTGQVVVLFAIPVTVAGETLGPTGGVVADYDPNLLSDVICSGSADWRCSTPLQNSAPSDLRAAPLLAHPSITPWRNAALWPSPGLVAPWQQADSLTLARDTAWREAFRLDTTTAEAWQPAPRLTTSTRVSHREALPLRVGTTGHWRARLTLFTHQGGDAFREALPVAAGIRQEIQQQGPLILDAWESPWREATYAFHGPNDGPPVNRRKIYTPPVGYVELNLQCLRSLSSEAGVVHLDLKAVPCLEAPRLRVPRTRSYRVINSAALVRWPDLTPLPVISMTVETDFDSWCWALTATLAGPDAWALVQPNPLACEVQATINGQVWRFLLDVPSQSRAFNQDRVTLKGRSRSAWLHDPYTPHRNLSQIQARDMTQLATLALENTGWSLEWLLEDWIVPAGRYTSTNTPIGALIRLANVTDDGIYTHPTDQIITLHKRWPVASWLLDGEPMDVLIPEAAILSLTQSPVYTQPLNGVYVSGISHGALALVKITGTDGALQPAEPITDELLCDEAGVAARQRGLNALSDAGAGWEMDAETLFAPNAAEPFPLVPPGQIVSIAGLKGISRSCRITAQRSGGVLSVRQSIGLERREVEDA